MRFAAAFTRCTARQPTVRFAFQRTARRQGQGRQTVVRQGMRLMWIAGNVTGTDTREGSMAQSRRMIVLRAVIEDYIRSQEPVGSSSLTKHHDLGVSSATVRARSADAARDSAR